MFKYIQQGLFYKNVFSNWLSQSLSLPMRRFLSEILFFFSEQKKIHKLQNYSYFFHSDSKLEKLLPSEIYRNSLKVDGSEWILGVRRLLG